jgi:V8-like Glu-specific endopeptidase
MSENMPRGNGALVVSRWCLAACRCRLCAVGIALLCAASGGQALATDKPAATLKVFGTDDRQIVGDTTQFPWSCIGRIEATWTLPNGELMVSRSTGTLVGRSVVLTAGHAVYDQTEGWADDIVFTPGLNGTHEPFGHAHALRTLSQTGWVESDNNQYDIAMIVLDSPLGSAAGYMNVVAEPDSFFVERNLNTAGYPGETQPGNLMYFTSGSSMDVQGGLIRDMLDSEPGQSGSPIWYYGTDPPNRKLVGVLTGTRELAAEGEDVAAYNVAVRIDSAFAQWINESLAKYDSATREGSQDTTPPPPTACGAGLPTAMLLLGFAGGLRFATRRRH